MQDRFDACINRASGESRIDMTVSGDTTYYYIVTACNAHGESNDSNETVAVTGVLTTYLKFDEVSGSTAADSSGNGWDAMLYNGPSWVSGVYGIISIAIILVAFPAAFGSSMEKRYQDALRDHGAGDSKVAGARAPVMRYIPAFPGTTIMET